MLITNSQTARLPQPQPETKHTTNAKSKKRAVPETEDDTERENNNDDMEEEDVEEEEEEEEEPEEPGKKKRGKAREMFIKNLAVDMFECAKGTGCHLYCMLSDHLVPGHFTTYAKSSNEALEEKQRVVKALKALSLPVKVPVHIPTNLQLMHELRKQAATSLWTRSQRERGRR